MKICKIIEQQSSSLILFFGGWATDENPFQRLKSSEYDVVMLYDYTTLEDCKEEIRELVSSYSKVELVAWSMGVWAASAIWQKYELPTKKIKSATAINGTLRAIDSEFGINPMVFEKTVDNLPQGLPRFNLRMCGTKSQLESYNSAPSLRDSSDAKQELIAIQEKSSFVDSIPWSKALIGSRDLIFTPQNQLNFWKEYKATHSNELEIVELEEPHFIFNSFSSWEEIVYGE